MAIELRSSFLPASRHAPLAARASCQWPAIAGEKLFVGCRPVEVTISVFVRQIAFAAALLGEASMKRHGLAEYMQPRAFEADSHKQSCVLFAGGDGRIESAQTRERAT